MFNHRIYNPNLNPNLWKDGDTLHTDVSERLLKIAKDFYSATEITAKLKDIILIGSSANYNWTPDSDIDVHLVIDIDELGMPDETTVKNYLDALKQKWNAEHDIFIKGHKVETYIQGEDHETHATGIFSLLKNKWLSKPVKEKVEIDRDLIKKMFGDYVLKINRVSQSPTPEKLKALLDDIYKMRQKGLDSEGELSTENLVFKLIRSKGFLEKIKELKTKIYDKSVSLNESDQVE
jgi:predicted nucleotidyltransferase